MTMNYHALIRKNLQNAYDLLLYWQDDPGAEGGSEVADALERTGAALRALGEDPNAPDA